MSGYQTTSQSRDVYQKVSGSTVKPYRGIELRDGGRSWRQIPAALSVSTRTVIRVYEQGVAKGSSQAAGTSDAVKQVARA